MAKSRSRKKKKKSFKVVALKPQNYIRKAARKLPIYEYRILPSWKEIGKTHVFVTRLKSNGHLILGVYLVDMLCLGMKDTFYYEEIKIEEYEVFLNQMGVEMEKPVKCKPQLALNIIYGAIEYAEGLGFKPHKDFKITKYILEDVAKLKFLKLEFGQDGKPFYTPGPEDNVKFVLETLRRNVGDGNFNYFIEANPTL